MGFDTPGRTVAYRPNEVIFAKRRLCLLILAMLTISACGFAAAPDKGDNPLLATYDGGTVTLHQLEEYVREMPLAQRIPFVSGGGDWRTFMAGQLAQSVTLTSKALEMGVNMDPGYLRARDYFIQEYLCYLVLRDNFTNKMDVSPEKQQQEYDTHKADYWLSPTVTLRIIRTRDSDKMASAAAELKGGADFQTVEMKFSQVSPRYRGVVLGPFPSVVKRAGIPPPDEVVASALGMEEGQTTGPLKVGDFEFLVKTEKKTPGRQQSVYDVAEQVEAALRKSQAGELLPELIDAIQKELGVEVDEALFASEVKSPNDLLATIGATRILRQEYTDLNGNVRGPAASYARTMPTKLKQFVLPYMIKEWGKLHDYMEREESRKAVYYYDLQHLANKVSLQIADRLLPPPSDAELRVQFQKNIADFSTKAEPAPKFEDHREDMLSAIMQQRGPESERRVRQAVLSSSHFKPVLKPKDINITALEAIVAAGNQLTSNSRLLKIAPERNALAADGSTPYEEVGRAPQWQISYLEGDSTSISAVMVNGPAELLSSDDPCTSLPVMSRWNTLLRFDTDSLKRHAIDKGLGDYMAKLNNHVQVTAVVDFSYSKDDPTSPTDCLISYYARPVGTAVKEEFTIRYTGDNGDITKRRLGEAEPACPTCTQPQLPPAYTADLATTKSAS